MRRQVLLRALVWVGCVSVLAGLLAPLDAHHITRFSYTWMQVGKAEVDGYRLMLLVKPPEDTVGVESLNARPAPPEERQKLGRYTHHFQLFVENARLQEPVPYLRVTLSARMEDGFREDFTLQPRFEERGFHYGANVRLTRRGRYDLVVTLSPESLRLSEHSRRRDDYFRTRRAKFDFEFGYEGLKELMGDLYKKFSKVSGAVMDLGLPQAIGPGETESVVKQIRELERLATVIPTVRIGEEQARFVALSEEMGESLKRLAGLVEKGDLDAAARAMAGVRIGCSACHQIYREGELAGR